MSRVQANLVMLLAAVLWGAGNVAQQTVLQDVGPLTAVGIRGVLALLVVLPMARAEARKSRPYTRADWRLALWMSLLFAIGTALYQAGYAGTTVTNAGFLVNLSAVLTPLFACCFYRQRLCMVAIPAALLALGGIYLLGGGSLASITWGDGLCLLAAATFSVWIIEMGRLTQRTGRPVMAAAVQFATLAALGLPAGLALETFTTAGFVHAIPQLLWLGIVSTGFAYLLSAISQANTTATDAGILMSAESLFGAAAAFLLLGEVLTAGMLIGAGLIVAAVVLVQLPQDLLMRQAMRIARWLHSPHRTQARA